MLHVNKYNFGPLTEHHDHSACADSCNTISGQALPAPMVVFTERLQQEGAVS